MNVPYVDQIRVGRTKRFGQKDARNRMDQSWESSLYKKRMTGKLWLNRSGIMGDDCVGIYNPTASDKALFAYSADHYDYWQKILEPTQFQVGGMGENLVISNVNEYTLFIGDTFRFGEALIQVSQPRLPCWRLARHIGNIHFAKDVQESGRTGWHFRVLKEGFIRDESELELIDRPYPEWSIAMCNELLHTDNHELSFIYELTECHLLSKEWLTYMNKRLRGQSLNEQKRIYGPNIG